MENISEIENSEANIYLKWLDEQESMESTYKDSANSVKGLKVYESRIQSLKIIAAAKIGISEEKIEEMISELEKNKLDYYPDILEDIEFNATHITFDSNEGIPYEDYLPYLPKEKEIKPEDMEFTEEVAEKIYNRIKSRPLPGIDVNPEYENEYEKYERPYDKVKRYNNKSLKM